MVHGSAQTAHAQLAHLRSWSTMLLITSATVIVLEVLIESIYHALYFVIGLVLYMSHSRPTAHV